MANTRNDSKSLLLSVPLDIYENSIFSFLTKKEKLNTVAAFSITSKSLNSFFKPTLAKLKKSKLALHLQQVIYADYDHVKITVTQNPSWIFENIKCSDNDPEMSPLKFALKVYDAYMLQLFAEIIKNNSEHVELFIQQVNEQVEHINSNQMSDAYKKYYSQYELWLSNKLSDDELKQAWLQLVKQQFELLPWHILKELCRPGEAWSHLSDFDIDKNPAPDKCEIIPYQAGIFQPNPMPLQTANSGFGVEMGLIRGTSNYCCGAKGNDHIDARKRHGGHPNYDSLIISQLFKKRKEQSEKIIEMIRKLKKMSRCTL